jgi:hypothetical protein
MMPDIADTSVDESPAPLPKRGKGRPRKDGSPQGSRAVKPNGEPVIAPFVPDPPFKNFFSDHENPAQKTRACWGWWGRLSTPFQNQIDAHVYRDWPVTNDPPEDWCKECKLIMSAELGNCPRCGTKLEAQDFKYIDKIIGVEPIKNDQEFIDKYGAGDYRLYLNANPPEPGKRRTLATCYIKGTHDFRTYAPADRRIQDIANLSLTDPLNTAYVAWLRSQGKIPDDDKTKEKEEMAASGVLVEKLIDRVDKLTDRAIEKAERTETQTTPAETARTPEEHLNDALGLVERLSKLTARPESNGKSDLATLMEIMDRLRAASDPAPYLKLIAEQGEKIHEIEMRHLNEKLDLLKSSIDKPPQTTVTTTDGTNISSLIEKAVQKAVEKAGVGEDDNAWYVEPLKQLVPVAIPALMAGLQNFLMPRPTQPAAPPMNPGFPGPAQAQAALPAPQQQAQPQPQAQPQAQPSAAQQEIIHILTAISAPVIDSLSRDEGGDDFADMFVQEHGNRAFRLISSFAPEQIAATLYQFPLIAPNMTQFPQEKVLKFAQEFKSYSPDAYDKKMAAKEAGGGAA